MPITDMEWGRNINPNRGPPLNAVPEGSRTEFFKQRRQLLWLTFGLVIYYCAHVQLGQEAEAQGVKLVIHRPGFLVVAAWCAWAWSFWRYWQYERTHPDPNYRTWREHQTFQTVVKIAERKAYSESASSRPQDLPANSTVEIMIDRDIQTSPTLDGGLHIKNFGLTRQSLDGRRAIAGTTEATLSEREFAYAQRQGRRDFWVGRPFALDYRAPYFLALLAPAAGLWTWFF